MKTTQKKKYWIYVLHCENKSFYIGYTIDLTKRYLSHLNGSARCKYTRSFKPTGIAQCWQVEGSKASAMMIERYLKKLSREGKNLFVLDPQKLCHIFPEAIIFDFSKIS